MGFLDSELDRSASARKLSGGLFRVVSVCLFYVYLGPDWVSDIQDYIVSAYNEETEPLGYAAANLLSSLFRAGIGLFCLYWFVLGIYKIYTFNMYLHFFEVKLTPWQKANMTDIDPSYSNIHDALRYRDAKMKTMSTEKAADFLMQTNSLLNSTNNKAVLGYINSKMTMMTPDQRIDFLRGKK